MNNIDFIVKKYTEEYSEYYKYYDNANINSDFCLEENFIILNNNEVIGLFNIYQEYSDLQNSKYMPDNELFIPFLKIIPNTDSLYYCKIIDKIILFINKHYNKKQFINFKIDFVSIIEYDNLFDELVKNEDKENFSKISIENDNKIKIIIEYIIKFYNGIQLDYVIIILNQYELKILETEKKYECNLFIHTDKTPILFNNNSDKLITIFDKSDFRQNLIIKFDRKCLLNKYKIDNINLLRIILDKSIIFITNNREDDVYFKLLINNIKISNNTIFDRYEETFKLNKTHTEIKQSILGYESSFSSKSKYIFEVKELIFYETVNDYANSKIPVINKDNISDYSQYINYECNTKKLYNKSEIIEYYKKKYISIPDNYGVDIISNNITSHFNFKKIMKTFDYKINSIQYNSNIINNINNIKTVWLKKKIYIQTISNKQLSISNTNAKFHYIYIVRPKEYVLYDKNVYKIGKSEQYPSNNVSRCTSYGIGSEIYFISKCNDATIDETNLKKLFNKKFERHVFGIEFFVGDVNKMIKVMAGYIESVM
jgi:hypothetical protein